MARPRSTTTRTRFIVIRLHPDLWERLNVLAPVHLRSVANLCEYYLWRAAVEDLRAASLDRAKFFRPESEDARSCSVQVRAFPELVAVLDAMATERDTNRNGVSEFYLTVAVEADELALRRRPGLPPPDTLLPGTQPQERRQGARTLKIRGKVKAAKRGARTRAGSPGSPPPQ